MARKKQPWKVGDLFTIPMLDGTQGLGQVLGFEADALHSVCVAVLNRRAATHEGPPPPSRAEMISTLYTTRDLLDRGEWRVVGTSTPLVPTHLRPYENLRAKGWIGLEIEGSGIIREFLEAYHGLRPWDYYFDPLYFEKLLLDPSKKPAGLVYKRDKVS